MAFTVLLQQMQHEYGVVAAPITSKVTATTTSLTTTTTATSSSAATKGLVETAATAGIVTKNANKHEMELEIIMTTSSSSSTTKKLTQETKTFEDAAAAAAAAAAAITTNYNTRLRKRHSHGQSHSFRANYRDEMSSQEMEWSKSCGGDWLEDIAKQLKAQKRSGSKRCMQYKKLLRKLQLYAGREYRKLRPPKTDKSDANSTTTPTKTPAPAIDIREMSIWRWHNGTYKFLPVLSSQSNIALRSWHRQMQIYVAAFAYMRRAQLYWDYHHMNEESPVAKELNKLKESAHHMLCSIESTINNTNIAYGHKNKQQSIAIKTISRQKMQSKLENFQTKTLSSADPTIIDVDIKFLKHHYIYYLHEMTKHLRTHAVRLCPGTTTTATAAVTKNEKTETQLLKLKPNNDDILLKPKKSQKHRQRHQRTSH